MKKMSVFLIMMCLLILGSATSQAVEKSMVLQGGLGLSMPSDYNGPSHYSPYGTGFFLEGQYVVHTKSWFKPIAYGGLEYTSPSSESCSGLFIPCEVSSKSLFVGGKIRLMAPIPYIAPYFEIGVGGSFGSFKVHVSNVDRQDSGVFFHIPMSIGIAVGKNHSTEIVFTYLFYPSIDLTNGAFAVGIQLARR